MGTHTERIQVEIFGSTYSLRGGADPSAVRTLAQDLDARMQRIAEAAPGADPVKVAVLAALRLADEVLELRRSAERREETLSGRALDLANRLGSVMAEAGLRGTQAALDADLPLG